MPIALGSSLALAGDNEDVLGFDVAMNDAARMGAVERIGDLHRKRDDLHGPEGPGGETLMARFPFKVLHHEKHTAVAFADVEEHMTALAEQVLSAEVALGRARFGGPEILLSPARVLGLSMILHELYTNAVKYGALCTDDGGVALDWERKGEEVELIWSECGPPCTHESSTSGFGQRMIAMAVQSDLNGTIERDWRPEGLTATIRFPID